MALVYEGAGSSEHLTYGELGEGSSRFAGALRDAGVERGDRVAVMLPKSVELLVALLAIWRVGAVHVPLFTAFGSDAVDHRVRDSGSSVVITDAPNRSKLGATGSVTKVFSYPLRIAPWQRATATFLMLSTAELAFRPVTSWMAMTW